MKILKITKKDLDKDNYYIGEEDFSEYNKKYDGKIEIDCDLGTVRFKKGVYASYSIEAKSGSGISAGDGISAGWGISAGDGISAGSGISAGDGISAGLGISAGSGISVGEGISAGWGISAGDGISAGWGISAGSGISAGLELSIGLNIFAGVSRHTNAQGDYKKITCSKLVKGTVCYGDLVETGEKEISLSCKEVSIELDGKNYTAVIK